MFKLIEAIAIDRSLTSKLEDAREALIYKIAELISIYKSSFNQGSHPQQLMIASNLQLLPVYILGMIKNVNRVVSFLMIRSFFGM